MDLVLHLSLKLHFYFYFGSISRASTSLEFEALARKKDEKDFVNEVSRECLKYKYYYKKHLIEP